MNDANVNTSTDVVTTKHCFSPPARECQALTDLEVGLYEQLLKWFFGPSWYLDHTYFTEKYDGWSRDALWTVVGMCELEHAREARRVHLYSSTGSRICPYDGHV